MANPQKENGYTAIANEILEKMAQQKINGTQSKIILLVWRYTYGFSRKECEMSDTFISKATGIYKNQISRELNKLIKSRIIKVIKQPSFNSTRVISFNKNYDEWELNRVEHSKNSTVLEKECSTVLEKECSTVLEKECSTVLGLEYQENNNKTNIKTNINTLTQKEEKKVECDNKKLKTQEQEKSFEVFWSAYPKKTAKSTALRAWEKLKPDMELVSKILEALEKQKNTSQWQKENGQFIPYPATWLNGKRWEDEIEEYQKPIDYNWGTEGVDFL